MSALVTIEYALLVREAAPFRGNVKTKATGYEHTRDLTYPCQKKGHAQNGQPPLFLAGALIRLNLEQAQRLDPKNTFSFKIFLTCDNVAKITGEVNYPKGQGMIFHFRTLRGSMDYSISRSRTMGVKKSVLESGKQ